MSTTATAWRQLGKALVTRRVQIDPRYRNRRTFCADTHSGKPESWYRLITDLENGARNNYSRETLAAFEVAYRLPSGSIDRFIEDGNLAPLEAGAEPVGTSPPEPEAKENSPPLITDPGWAEFLAELQRRLDAAVEAERAKMRVVVDAVVAQHQADQEKLHKEMARIKEQLESLQDQKGT